MYYFEYFRKFGIVNSKESMPNHVVVDKKSKLVDQTTYKCVIGSLLYLSTSRPKIMHNVYICAKF